MRGIAGEKLQSGPRKCHRAHQLILQGHLRAGPRRRRPDRTRLRVLHRRVRFAGGQAGWRVLHASVHRPHAGGDAGAGARRGARSLLRLRRHVRAGRRVHLSFIRQESKDFTYRLCRMNLFISRAGRQDRTRQFLFQRPAGEPATGFSNLYFRVSVFRGMAMVLGE
jgi:hypothetical protein